MVKVQLVYTKSCIFCPAAKQIFKDLKKNHKFDYEEIDAISPEGQKIVSKYSIMSVPSVIIDNNLKFVGIPSKDKAIEAITK